MVFFSFSFTVSQNNVGCHQKSAKIVHEHGCTFSFTPLNPNETNSPGSICLPNYSSCDIQLPLWNLESAVRNQQEWLSIVLGLGYKSGKNHFKENYQTITQLRGLSTIFLNFTTRCCAYALVIGPPEVGSNSSRTLAFRQQEQSERIDWPNRYGTSEQANPLLSWKGFTGSWHYQDQVYEDLRYLFPLISFTLVLLIAITKVSLQHCADKREKSTVL